MRRLFVLSHFALAFTLLLLPQQASAQRASSSWHLSDFHGVYHVHGVNAFGERYRGRVHIESIGDKALFRWTIGRDRIDGQGRLEGNRIVVHANWGRIGPTIYTITDENTLFGTWDEGQAREKLARRIPGQPVESQLTPWEWE